MYNNIKMFCLIVITVCVFVMTVLNVLELLNKNSNAAQVPKIDLINHRVEPQLEPLENIEKTNIVFNEMKHDFGDIKEGAVVSHTFEFTNSGTVPLIISNASGSCGCTVPTYPKEPVAPGMKGKIEVQFNSAGREGLQNKTVTVTANTEPAATILTITSNVEK